MAFTYVTGSGTQADPYVITDTNGWQELATYVRNGNPMYNEYVELGADIDFQSTYDRNGYAYGEYGTSGGSLSYSITFGKSGNPFCGNFNGNNHKLERPLPDQNSLFYVSGSVVIKNINFIFWNQRYAIEYGNEDVDLETPIFENLLFCTRCYDYQYGCIHVYTSNQNTYNNVTFKIDKCVLYTDLTSKSGNAYYYSKPIICFYGNMNTVNAEITNCVCINSPVILRQGSITNKNIYIKRTLCYFIKCDAIISNGTYQNQFSQSDIVLEDCYIKVPSTHTNIDIQFSNQWTRITEQECLNESTFTNWDFINTFTMDSVFGMPLPSANANKYVYVMATYNGNSDINALQSTPVSTSNSSGAFYFLIKGQSGLVLRGSNINFGMYKKFPNGDKYILVTNLTTLNTGQDYETIQNIQTNIVYNYEIKPNLSGSGNENDPFLILTYDNLLTYIHAFYHGRFFSENNYSENNARGKYFSIQNDIVCNDITLFNNWNSNSLPTNVINTNYGMHVSGILDGNGYKIIGLCGNDIYLDIYGNETTQTYIKNVKFDYLYGRMTLRYKGINFEDCEFNGYFNIDYPYNETTFTRCLINKLPNYKRLLDDYNNFLGYKNGDTMVLRFTDCIINAVMFSIGDYVGGSGFIFTDCLFTGLYNSISYIRYTGQKYSPTFTNCYILEDSVINKEVINGLTYINNQTYSNGDYSQINLDFTNIFDVHNHTTSNYGTVLGKNIILKNKIPRFLYFGFLCDDNNGLDDMTYFKYMTDNLNLSFSTTLTINQYHYLYGWSDIGHNSNTTRTFDLSTDTSLRHDIYLTFTIPVYTNLTGYGIKDSPYLINNKTDLITLSTIYQTANTSNINFTYYKITNDIVFQDASLWEQWTTVQPSETWNTIINFCGSIDGDNHKITGLYKEATNDSTRGFFIRTSYNQNIEIKKLKIEKSVYKITKSNFQGQCEGGFVSSASFTSIDNLKLDSCEFSGNIYINISSGYDSNYYTSIGGLVGCESILSKVEVKNCTFSGKIEIVAVTGRTRIGGILACRSGLRQYFNSYIQKCTNKGTIILPSTGTFPYYVCGIAIFNGDSTITISECYNKSNIISGAENVGIYGISLTGKNGNYSHIVTDCYNCGNIETTSASYYLCGITMGAYRVSNCYNYGVIKNNSDSTKEYAIAYDTTNTPSNCYYLENTATNAGGGTALNSAQFAVTSNFTGFDFINTWEMDNAAGRPKLINNFEGELSTLIVTSSNPDYGTVTGGGDYEYGEVVEIEAFPYAGCAFEAWSDGSKRNPRFITVRRNMMFQALFSGAYPIRLLDYYGLLQLWSNLQGYAAQKLSTKVDKTQAGDTDTPIYFNSSGIPTPCTSLDLNTSGNAASATKLETARKINTVEFDGTTDITLTPTNIGLGNVDNTSDLDKPISNATQNALMLLESDIDKVSYDNITYRMIDDIFNS